MSEEAVTMEQTLAAATPEKKRQETKGSPRARNPYLDGRREWNERYGDYISRERSWKLVAMLSSFVSLAAVAGLIYIGSQSKFVPFVVGVDDLGRAQAYGAVSPTDKADPRIIKASVIKFVEAWRSVSSDAWLQRKQIFDAYAFIARADPAYVTLSEYWQTAENEPFARAEKETVSVEVKSVLPVTDDSYQIEWVETLRDRRGKQKGEPQRYRGSVTWTQGEVAQIDERALWVNPFQIYFPTVAWSKVY